MTTTARAERSEANLALFQRFFECYLNNDYETLRNEVMAPDVVWRIPGRHPLSGDHRGVDELVAYFDEAGKSNFTLDVLYLHANEDYVVQIHRGWSNTGDGSELDTLFALICRIENHRIVESHEFVEDQAATDAFFSRHYPLAPVPARLRDGG